jgi:hypothetical protein
MSEKRRERKVRLGYRERKEARERERVRKVRLGYRARGGVAEGGGSVCPFVCVSRKVIRPHWSDSRPDPPSVWAARFRERWGLGSDYTDSRRDPPPVWAARFRERWGLGSDYRWID